MSSHCASAMARGRRARPSVLAHRGAQIVRHEAPGPGPSNRWQKTALRSHGVRTRVRCLLLAGLVACLISPPRAGADPIKVVAAENVYGDIARQIGGTNVAVKSILTSPSQDPHEFEAGVSTARAMAEARLVIYNGVDYDPWAEKLLAVSGVPGREIIVVAKLAHKKPGDNPHLWYEPATVSALGEVLAAQTDAARPGARPGLRPRPGALRHRHATPSQRIAALRGQYAGTPVTATEPVFDYMADAIGLTMRNGRFQLAVMNGTEPGAARHRGLRERSAHARGQGPALQPPNQPGSGRKNAPHCRSRRACRWSTSPRPSHRA